MSPPPVDIGICSRCGASVFLGQQWCQRCFTSADAASYEMPGPDTAEPDIAEPDIAEPDIAEPDIAEPDTAEPDTAAWKSVHLVSEAWDLTANDGEPAEYPMTRMEIRRPRNAKPEGRIFRRFMLTVVTLVFLGGLASGGVLVWQRYLKLTPQRYVSEVKPVVLHADATIASVRSMIDAVAVSEVPTAGQVLQARTAQRSFGGYATKLTTIGAPSSRRLARAELIAGCRGYADLMGDVTAAGGTNVLVDMGAFNAHLRKANRAWRGGTSRAGLHAATLPKGPTQDG